jgi:hypothetical protein
MTPRGYDEDQMPDTGEHHPHVPTAQMADPPAMGEPLDPVAAVTAPLPSEAPRQGLLLIGVTWMSAEGVDRTSVFLGADKVDSLIASGTWKPGQLNDVETYPPPHAWPPAWRHLRDR